MTPTEIRALRDRLDMTQKEFGAALEVDGAAVSQWESGTTQPTKAKREILRFWRKRLDKQSEQDWKRFAAQAGGALSIAIILNYISGE
jgi:transcriptional regulator with XRE-family HTH domain